MPWKSPKITTNRLVLRLRISCGYQTTQPGRLVCSRFYRAPFVDL